MKDHGTGEPQTQKKTGKYINPAIPFPKSPPPVLAFMPLVMGSSLPLGNPLQFWTDLAC